MEEIDVLRAQAIASMSSSPVNPNSNNNNSNSKKTPPPGAAAREEGELVSSEDDDLKTSSAAQSTSSTPKAAEERDTVVKSLSTPNSAMGKCVSSVKVPASSVDRQVKTSVKKNFKPGSHYNPGWSKPPLPDTNLVIRFSDGESESDSEDDKPQKPLAKKDNITGVHAYKKLPTSSHTKTEVLQRTSSNQLKMMHKKVSLSHTFISSMTKINGANSKTPGSSSAGRVFQSRSSGPLTKTSSSQEGECSQSVRSNNSEADSLRQQIAIRENQLKVQLKSVQQRQEGDLGLYHEHIGTRLKNNAAVQRRPASVSFSEFSSNEQAKKRLKPDKPNCGRLISDGEQEMRKPATDPTSKLQMVSRENNGICGEGLVRNSKEVHVGRTDTVANRSTQALLPSNLQGVKDSEPSVSFNETIYPTVPTSKMPNKQGSCSIAGNTTNDSNSGNGTGLVDPSVPSRRISQLAQMTSGVHEGAASLRKMLSPEKSATKSSNYPRDSWDPHSSTSQQKNAPHEHMRMQSIELNQVSHGDTVLKPSCDSIFDKGPVFVPAGKVADAYATPINTRPLNSLEHGNLLVDDNMDVQTLAKMEEIQDKELGEAQEHRRMCEVEERKALKAYRKAQSALVEANTRCQNLFRRRDSISAQLQGCIIEESSSSWSSRCRNHMDTMCNLVDNVPGTALGQFPLSYQKQKLLEGSNQLGSDSIQGKDGALLPSHQHSGALSLVSQPCMVPHADEDKDAVTTDFRNFQSRLSCGNERSVGMGEMECRDKPEKKSSASDAQDYALLEASLRTELFSRLGSKTVSRNSDLHCGAEGSVSRGVESLAENKSQSGLVNQPLVEEEQNLISDGGGTKGLGESIIQRTIEVTKQCLGDMFPDLQRRAFVAPDGCSMAPTEACRPTVAGPDMPSSALRSVFNHLKNTALISSIGFQTRNKQKSTSEIAGEAYDLCGTAGAHLIEDKGTDMQGFGSYVCDPSVDPFWPLCMFELRGKCNNEKCPWQHVKDFGKNVKQHDGSERADCEVGTSSDLGEFNDRPKLSQLMSVPPIYIVSSDILGVDLRTSGSVLARSMGQFCLNRFSTSLIVNSPGWKYLLADAPFLHVTDGCIEGQGSWDRQSLYLNTQDSAMKQHKQGLADPEQSLELAIVLFSEDVSRREGKKKALAVLSRALEADPASVVLWMVYLHMYYSNEKVIGSGKDDMFLHAIQKNEGSYELWLICINSRIHVEDRLVAYDTALGALCRFASSGNCDKMHTSACILDLFLQMMEFLRMSGDIGKAVQRIYGLLPTETGISDWGSVSLSNILSFLSVSDKSIFWVCCVYLVMYRKLPDSVLQQFEFEKELQLPIEWPSPVHLTADDKCRVLKLMEVAIDSVALDVDSYSHERGNNYKYAHLLAVYHAKCVEILKDSECSKNLVKGYIELYPSCLDFVLILARLNNKFAGDLGYEGFENALHSWPKEVPGIQCIWNQYVQYALEKGEIKYAEVLMVRWFEDSWKVSSLQAEELDGCISYPKSKDELFGLLNLALHKLLQKDQVEARCMIDKALKIASPEDFKHCVSEHAIFVLSNRLESMEDGSFTSGGILSLLNGYLCDPWFSPVSEPLSRKFCQDIRKPRTRQLVNCMLGSVSRDCSLLNTILNAWYGPLLLPKDFGELKDLVDHVEVLTEIFPANYHLALSACELIIRHHNFSNDIAFSSAAFWASSLVVNALYQSNPLAPEETWVEVCGALSNLGELQGISERFHQQAVSVYPFSVKLWKSYFDFSKVTGNTGVVIDAARKRGVILE